MRMKYAADGPPIAGFGISRLFEAERLGSDEKLMITVSDDVKRTSARGCDSLGRERFRSLVQGSVTTSKS